MNNSDIAIVGMSCLFPGAKNITDFWDNLINGVDSITEVPENKIESVYFQKGEQAVDRFYCNRGGFVPDTTFNPIQFGFLPLAVQGMDPDHLLTMKLVYEALEDASVFKKNVSLKKGSIIVGKGNYAGVAMVRAIDIVHNGEQIAEILRNAAPNLSPEEVDKVKKAFQTAKGRYQADTAMGLIPNLMVSNVANKLDMEGPAYTIDAACASSLIALDHSVKELLSGRCDIAIAGGTHVGQSAPFWSLFTQLDALSHKKQISPFSEDADGLLIGEGSGFVVLKRLEKAQADNDRIYAVIKGVGVSSDGTGVGVMVPSIKGQQKAILEAWNNAGIDVNKVGYIEAHGTATTVGDKTELETLSNIFPKKNAQDSEILIGSVKSNIGHAMPAAGIAGVIKTALALYNKQIPPTLHCERPLKQMEQTRFRPAQKLYNWDENKYPTIAGVNAFGFGGINAHVVLEAYGKKTDVAEKSKSFANDVVVVTANSKDELLEALDKREFSASNLNGNYRLALFNPTPDRIEKAKSIISRDKAWKGRQDIWFTNTPVLKDGGKVAFLFSGFDLVSDPETDSIEKHFKRQMILDTDFDPHSNLEHAIRLFRKNELIDQSLKSIGVVPDLNAGHSMGEWYALYSAGMVTDSAVKDMLRSIDPDKYVFDNAFFLAVGCGAQRLSPWTKNIPDLYLANDNCTNQALLCGTDEALIKISEILKSEQIFYQKLTFQSGFHTPFFADKLDLFEKGFKHIECHTPQIPVWSATSLELYPKTNEEIKDLFIEHLLTTVRFRELTEKLYKEENTRVFIQIGAGGLVGFIDDTLAGQSYSAISTSVPTRTGLEQMRRILALLFIEGRDVDSSFLGVMNDKTNNAVLKPVGVELPIGMNTNIITNFSLLKDFVKNHKSNTPSAQVSFDALDTTNIDDPLVRIFNENVKDLLQMQSEVLNVFQQKRGLQRSTLKEIVHIEQPKSLPEIETQKMSQPVAAIIVKRAGTHFVERLQASVEKYPFIMGHSLVNQPKGWSVREDLSPVIPMTMIFELLAEATLKQDPTKKITKLGPINALQWIELTNPIDKEIEGVWKTDDTAFLTIKGHSTGEITLRDTYSNPISEYIGIIDLGETEWPIPSIERIYDIHMFHGPTYQGITEVTDMTRKGIRGMIRKVEGKGSLLDNAGQMFGLGLQFLLKENHITFPVKIQEITMYDNFHDQSGEFECTCVYKEITPDFTIADIILKREGKLWCIARGWQNMRFELDEKLWNVMLSPYDYLLAEEIAPGVRFFYKAYTKIASWNFIMKRYLNVEEKKHYDKLMLNQRIDYLISRIAAKDAVNSFIKKKYDKEFYYYPVEFYINKDKHNKPFVDNIPEANDVTVSLAHKGSFSVGIASDKPVGADIETIEERGDGFMELSFTTQEIALIKEKGDTAEWSTRFWVAKESYGKMLGLGLSGNPKRYEVEAIEGDILTIKDTRIQTIKHTKNLIIGWTI